MPRLVQIYCDREAVAVVNNSPKTLRSARPAARSTLELRHGIRRNLWALPPDAAAGHQQSSEARLPVSSMGASDDVVVRLSSADVA